MTIKAQEKAKLYWACRRGMLELDLLLLPFLENGYDNLSDEERSTFIQLLAIEDPTLYQWFIAHLEPEDLAMRALVEKIIAYARRSAI
ncbi:MAG: succinate dehydrogenase assembly factor 2 family protein [Gammaproteobacteria bacterium]|jgi:antitoxin CptB|nr:succinate dehydrogenase assembly factor 2 family protein [Gammaproteobacteria bacterium]